MSTPARPDRSKDDNVDTHTTNFPPPASSSRRIAVLGLGEVGRVYAEALARAGHVITGYDPYSTSPVPGVTSKDTIREAVSNADIVLVLTPASASAAAAEQAQDAVPVGAVYADFTSSAPAAKKNLEHTFRHRPDVRLVDVAILGPVIQLGTQTALMAAGPAGSDIATVMQSIGADVEVVAGDVGDAMGHKLLRSVFMKGLASIVTEAVRAGAAAGHEPWIRDQIAQELAGDGHRTINRFLRGTVVHAARRSEEMEAASEYLVQLGLKPTMAKAAAELHRDQVRL